MLLPFTTALLKNIQEKRESIGEEFYNNAEEELMEAEAVCNQLVS